MTRAIGTTSERFRQDTRSPATPGGARTSRPGGLVFGRLPSREQGHAPAVTGIPGSHRGASHPEQRTRAPDGRAGGVPGPGLGAPALAHASDMGEQLHLRPSLFLGLRTARGGRAEGQAQPASQAPSHGLLCRQHEEQAQAEKERPPHRPRHPQTRSLDKTCTPVRPVRTARARSPSRQEGPDCPAGEPHLSSRRSTPSHASWGRTWRAGPRGNEGTPRRGASARMRAASHVPCPPDSRRGWRGVR